MYKPDGSPESTEFWSQISKARRTVRPNQTINFFVDPSEGHDDFLSSLSSLALLVKASEYTPRRASGRLRETAMNKPNVIPMPRRGIWGGKGWRPLSLPQYQTRGVRPAPKRRSHTSVYLSPSPLKALRACPESLEGERGIKGERVPLPPFRL